MSALFCVSALCAHSWSSALSYPCASCLRTTSWFEMGKKTWIHHYPPAGALINRQKWCVHWAYLFADGLLYSWAVILEGLSKQHVCGLNRFRNFGTSLVFSLLSFLVLKTLFPSVLRRAEDPFSVPCPSHCMYVMGHVVKLGRLWRGSILWAATKTSQSRTF